MKTKLAVKAIAFFVVGVLMVALLLFLPAGTLSYPGAWRLMGLLFIPMLILGVLLLAFAPDVLKKRLNAKEKTYRYRIWNSEMPCVFERRFVTVMPEKLDTEAMNQAARHLLGQHDFAAFCGNAKMKKSTIRYIRSLTVTRKGEEVHITVAGNGFLHNMVRIIVGTLVEVGRGERNPDSIPALFEGKRADAGFLAPPQGLCLMEVYY